MCNQMVTSEIRKLFHARFVKMLIINFPSEPLGEGNYQNLGGWRMADRKMRMIKCEWKNADNKTRIEKFG